MTGNPNELHPQMLTTFTKFNLSKIRNPTWNIIPVSCYTIICTCFVPYLSVSLESSGAHSILSPLHIHDMVRGGVYAKTSRVSRTWKFFITATLWGKMYRQSKVIHNRKGDGTTNVLDSFLVEGAYSLGQNCFDREAPPRGYTGI